MANIIYYIDGVGEVELYDEEISLKTIDKYTTAYFSSKEDLLKCYHYQTTIDGLKKKSSLLSSEGIYIRDYNTSGKEYKLRVLFKNDRDLIRNENSSISSNIKKSLNKLIGNKENSNIKDYEKSAELIKNIILNFDFFLGTEANKKDKKFAYSTSSFIVKKYLNGNLVTHEELRTSLEKLRDVISKEIKKITPNSYLYARSIESLVYDSVPVISKTFIEEEACEIKSLFEPINKNETDTWKNNREKESYKAGAINRKPLNIQQVDINSSVYNNLNNYNDDNYKIIDEDEEECKSESSTPAAKCLSIKLDMMTGEGNYKLNKSSMYKKKSGEYHGKR